ncbi:membrane-associated phospholipid phosphatase [Nocardiopsis mwathae]|uniref:Membrane-associated phospholipid phosphatase n=1 Tax=Nocardiopsis mwathae TaxID=1472723 RepID=A0A7W9YGC6_9ACTN|nr:phosphatase PAP2 family protein [Nocardiopsis mwathae]MBB6171628.1 membrane-associated phospholipid phosphatase [Nocardiopsis mwathae]
MSFPSHAQVPGHRMLMGAAATGSAAAFALTYALLVRTAAGQRIEDAILADASARRVDALHSGAADWASVLSGLEWLSAPVILAAGLAVLAVVGLARRRVRTTAVALATVALAAAATFVLKAEVLTRPPLAPGSGWGGGGNSFPSGHVTLAVALVLALLLVVPARLRPLAAGAGGLWAGAVAMTTISQGWHRPSDVIGSTLLAFALFCVATAFLSPPRRPGVSSSLLATAWAWLPVFVLAAVPLELLALSPAAGAPGLVGADVAVWLAAGVSAVPLLTAAVLLSLLEAEEPGPVRVVRPGPRPAAEGAPVSGARVPGAG